MLFDWSGQTCVNVYHIYSESPLDSVARLSLAAAFVDWWDDELKAEVSSTVSLERVTVQGLDAETDPMSEYTTGLPLQATSAAASAPNNCTFAVQWRTALSGRSYRGRTFHVGLTTTKYSSNLLTVPNQSTFTAAYGQLISDVTTEGYTLSVVSRYHNGTQRPSGIHTQIASVFVDRTLDSMRRRLPGRGS
jgi:hypothetical protein